MKNIVATQDKKSKQAAEKSQIRRWILKSVAETTPKTAVTLHSIKKFLDSKQIGISNNPEVKMILKNLVDNGNLIKINCRFAAGKPNQVEKQQATGKGKKRNEIKNLAKSNRGRKVKEIAVKEIKTDAKEPEVTESGAAVGQETEKN
ncbi:uncharacterized protein NPIL_538311 [Nephila pilipes]|uniref:H15 domain-containing protein n=1 Tax=Nephila pilipes TaxID=299642 RepID=A0A8X6TPL0_NEPPI|nr:uncharacterized protein NPIL_538311 [Nephila pilipes]